jgi:probable F420-dependent oxidoreductase
VPGHYIACSRIENALLFSLRFAPTIVAIASVATDADSQLGPSRHQTRDLATTSIPNEAIAMKFGLAFASSLATEPDTSLELCRRAEALGFESVWGGEHVIRPASIDSAYPYSADGRMPGEPETQIPDPLIWLAYVAASAPTLRLGTCILIVPQRNPLVLAKELATLDHLSAGRVELGIGVGWMKEEFNALGVPWERRGARTDEYVAAMRALWAGPEAEYHGEFVDFAPSTCSPRPVRGSIPILVGGDTPAAVRRAARIADGYFPGSSDEAELARLIKDLGEAATRFERDPSEIEISVIFGAQMADPVAGVERLAKLGVKRAMVPALFFAGADGLDRLEAFAELVVTSGE